MKLLISNPDGILLDQEGVSWVHLRLADGKRISIHPRHAPLLARLSSGMLCYQIDEQQFEKEINQGVLSIERDIVKCLVF